MHFKLWGIKIDENFHKILLNLPIKEVKKEINGGDKINDRIFFNFKNILIPKIISIENNKTINIHQIFGQK